ncbi:MAG: hypothetical protein PF636_08630 [Actinomycetota bacterium]|jgi:hypothetical protein|nr:hypothetical protein [Actinomycetota bacterium]
MVHRILVMAVALALCPMLAGCASNAVENGGETAVPVSPEMAIQHRTASAFGVDDSVVEATYVLNPDNGHGKWSVIVALGSVETTGAVDCAAARILAEVASVDTSDTIISLSVLSGDLGIPSSDHEWGALNYYWDRSRTDVEPLGSLVALSHSEADPPSDIQCECMLLGVSRGAWEGVDPSVLDVWAKEGTPLPVD